MSCRLLFVSAIMALIPALSLVASDKICTFDWFSNPQCPAHTDCIDPADYNGKTIKIPSNAAGIASEGLRLCLPYRQTAIPTDIIYIVDLSGSMHPMATSCNLETFEGDPYGKRAEALKAALSYHLTSAPQSHAGYIGFAGNVVSAANYGTKLQNTGPHLLSPRPLTDSMAFTDVVSRLQKHIDTYECYGGTNYRNALDTAIAWFSSPNSSPNGAKAIVFISDGAATGGRPTTQQIEYLKTNSIAVYGVFMGDHEQGDLRNLSEQSGGELYTVTREQSAGLNDLLQRVVAQVIVSPAQLTGLKVTVNGQTARKNILLSEDTPSRVRWLPITDRPLPLIMGHNTVRVEATFAPESTVSFSFVLDASGKESEECLRCRPRTGLQLLDSKGRPLPEIVGECDSIWVRLKYYGDEKFDSVRVLLSSNTDQEMLVVAHPRRDGDAWVFETSVPFSYGGKIAGNRVLEADFSDLIKAGWSNPEFIRDTASAVVPVARPLIVAQLAVDPNPVNSAASAGIPDFAQEILRSDPQFSWSPDRAAVALITVYTEEKISGIAAFREGYISIYDPVGNLVLGKTRMALSRDGTLLVFPWDLRNRSNRLVGSGTYLAVTAVTAVGGGVQILKGKIGVKR